MKLKNCGYTQLYLRKILFEHEIIEFNKMQFKVPTGLNYYDYRLSVENND